MLQQVNWKALAKKLVLAPIFIAIGLLSDRYFPLLRSYYQSILGGSQVTGEYVLLKQGYAHEAPYGIMMYKNVMELRQAGSAVFGTTTRTGKSWKLNGFTRDAYLSLSYESNDPSSTGTGVYALKRLSDYSFVGYWVGVECKANRRILLQCPAHAYFKDQSEEQKKFEAFVKAPCIELPEDDPPVCN